MKDRTVRVLMGPCVQRTDGRVVPVVCVPLLQIVSMWRDHLRSAVRRIPKYLKQSTLSRLTSSRRRFGTG